jgi:hypothetical protein
VSQLLNIFQIAIIGILKLRLTQIFRSNHAENMVVIRAWRNENNMVVIRAWRNADNMVVIRACRNEDNMVDINRQIIWWLLE